MAQALRFRIGSHTRGGSVDMRVPRIPWKALDPALAAWPITGSALVVAAAATVVTLKPLPMFASVALVWL